jgi:ACT domain-containing protein
MFAMIRLVDITGMNKDFAEMVDRMNALGSELGLSIHTMHEDIFNSMHTI